MKPGVYIRTTANIIITEEDIDKYQYTKDDIYGIVIVSDHCNTFEIIIDDLDENKKITRADFEEIQKSHDEFGQPSYRGPEAHEALEIALHNEEIKSILYHLNIVSNAFDEDSPYWVRGTIPFNNHSLIAGRNGVCGYWTESDTSTKLLIKVRELNLN